MRLAADAVLFHTADDRAYASVNVNGHHENHEVRSTGFRRWLVREFYIEQHRPPSIDAIQGALGVLEAKAHHDGPSEDVFVRVAPGTGSTIYLDLGRTDWHVVEITSSGWRMIDQPPGRFRRPSLGSTRRSKRSP